MRERAVIRIASLAQIEAGQLSVPTHAEAGRLKLLDGPLINLLLVFIQAVLLKKLSQLFVEAGVLRVAIQFSAQKRERIGQSLHRHQAREIAVEDLRILARAGLPHRPSASRSVVRRS